MVHQYNQLFKNRDDFILIDTLNYQISVDSLEQKYRIPVGVSTAMQHNIVSKTPNQKIFLEFEAGSYGSIELLDANFDSFDSLHTVEYHILLQQSARVDFFMSLVKAHSLAVVVYMYLQGSHSQAFIKGLYALDKDQNISINTFQYHVGANTVSDLVIKGMLKDQATVMYKGLIFIGSDAMKTEASQENKNILLSKQAKVISIPSIEVLQHDVQCSHGSAIGQFDKEQLWYLQNRGLNYKQAHELLIESFFQELISEQNVAVKDMVCRKMI